MTLFCCSTLNISHVTLMLQIDFFAFHPCIKASLSLSLFPSLFMYIVSIKNKSSLIVGHSKYFGSSFTVGNRNANLILIDFSALSLCVPVSFSVCSVPHSFSFYDHFRILFRMNGGNKTLSVLLSHTPTVDCMSFIFGRGFSCSITHPHTHTENFRIECGERCKVAKLCFSGGKINKPSCADKRHSSSINYSNYLC